MICGYTGADHKLAYLFENATEVSFTRILNSGTVVGTLSIDGNEITVYAPTADPGSQVEYTPSQTSGTAIGTLAIDGTSYTLYAPEMNLYGTTAPTASQGQNGAFYTYYDGTNTKVYVKSNGAWVQMFSSDASVVSL